MPCQRTELVKKITFYFSGLPNVFVKKTHFISFIVGITYVISLKESKIKDTQNCVHSS